MIYVIPQMEGGFKVCKQNKYTIKIGMDIHNVNGRKSNGEGYVLLKIPTHPYAHSNGYVFEHRVMFESVIDAYLADDVIIHHINGVKDDNRFSNLQMMDRGYHTKVHHKGSKRSKETRRRNSIATIKLGWVGKKHPMYKDVDDQLKELYMQGVPVAKIAEFTGVTRRTVYNKIENLGLKREIGNVK